MKSKNITEAAARCRAAWKAAPNAGFAWCCHHRTEVEKLMTGGAEARIRYILAHKPANEKIVRLDNFRPVNTKNFPSVSTFEKRAQVAQEESNELQKKLDAIDKQIDKLRASSNPIQRKQNAVENRLCRNLYKASSAIINAPKRLRAIAHKKDVPDHDWNGTCVKGTELTF
jgi:hypothetical protein